MAFFNLRTTRTQRVARRKKKDYYNAGYHNPLTTNEGASPTKRVAKRIALLVSALTMFVTALYWMLFSGAFGVAYIEVEGATRTSVDEIIRVTKSTLNRRRFLILNQHQSLFVVDSIRLNTRLTEEFALAYANAVPQLPHTLRISVKERVPAYRVKDHSGRGMLIDNEGVIVTAATEDDLNVHDLLTLTVPSLSSTSTGERLFDRTAMIFLQDVEEAFPSITQGYRVIELDLERVPVHDITVKTSEPWVIYMTDTLDPKLQFLNVDRALQDMKDERKKIQYIDVRLPNKIFYK